MSKQINYFNFKPINKKFRELFYEIRIMFKHIINNNFVVRKKLVNLNKIHFGAGSDCKQNFLNVDLNPSADVFLDLRNKLNIKNDSIEFIYSSHLVEHFHDDELIIHLQECYRILGDGGVLRLCIPDFEKVFHYYTEKNNSRLDEVRTVISTKLSLPEQMICRMDWVNKAVHEYGEHKICIDWEKIQHLLVFVGFKKANVVQTNFQSNIDLESRKSWSIYVDARK